MIRFGRYLLENFRFGSYQKVLFRVLLVLILLPISNVPQSAIAAVDNTYKNPGGEAFLKGTYLQVGVALNGRFGTVGAVPTSKGFFPTPRGNSKSYARTTLGFIADRNRNAGWIDGDFFLPGTPYEGWYVDVAGTTGRFDHSNGTSGDMGTISDIEVTSSSASVTHTVTINGVVISQRYSVPIGSGTFDGDQQLSIRVTISNPTGSAKSGIYYGRQVDPDNNVDTGGGYATNNQIEATYGVASSGYSLVSATSAASEVAGNSYLGLFSSDSRSKAVRAASSFSAPSTAAALYNATGFLSAVENSRTSGDAGIGMGFNLGTLNAGASTTFDFAYVLSSTSASQAVAAASAPPAPTGTPGNTQIPLSWTAPASADTIVGYRIFQSTDGTNFDSGTDQISTGLSKTITGLTNGTSYYYKVAALTGTSPYTVGTLSGASAAIVPRTVPGTPTSVTATRQNAQVSLSWTAPVSNGGSAITDYEIEYSSDTGTTWVPFTDSTSTSTSAVITGLSNGTEYIFRVKAENIAGLGSPSTSSAAVTPVAPFGLTMTLDKNSMIAGQTLTATITAFISDGVIYPDYGGSAPALTVSTDSSAVFATPSAWSSGVSTVVVTLKTAGNHSIVATSGAVSVTAGPVAVTHSTLTKYAITLATSVNENQVVTATITAQDAFSNAILNHTPTNPVLSSTGNQAVFGTLSSWTSGVATVTVSYAANGARNFIYTDGAISKTVLITVTVPTTPVVTSISPSTSTTDGGVTVTITGSQLTGTTGVTFGGVAATNIVVVSDTEVTVTNPANAEGDAIVVVTTSSGSDVDARTFSYTATAAVIAARAAAAAAAAARAEAARQAAANQALAQRIAVQAIPTPDPGTATGPISLVGLGEASAIFVAPEARPTIPGFSSLRVSGNSIEVVPTETFSGRMTVPVTVIEGGATVTLNIPIIVNPKPVPAAATTPVSRSATSVTWEPSSNAVSYKVVLNDQELCASATTSCSIPKILGPKSKMEVITLGNDGTVSSQVLPAYIPSKPIPVLDVKFGLGSSAITNVEIRKLKRFVSLMNEQGFTKVAITAFTDAVGGVTGAKALSLARSQSVARFLDRFLNVELRPFAKGIFPDARGSRPDANARKAEVAVQ